MSHDLLSSFTGKFKWRYALPYCAGAAARNPAMVLSIDMLCMMTRPGPVRRVLKRPLPPQHIMKQLPALCMSIVTVFSIATTDMASTWICASERSERQ